MTYFVGVVATRSLWSRLTQLISIDELAGSHLFICSQEPQSHILSSSQNDTSEVWDSLIGSIQEPLYANYLSTIEKLPLSFDISQSCPTRPLWMSYRPLSNSELSVYFKHIQILSHFLKTSFDYCLILEDDCKLLEGFSSLLTSLVTELSFDYIDLANGLNFIPSYHSSTHLPNFNSSISSPPWCSTRTACAYLISRRFAYHFLNHFPSHYVLPYDWALNFALASIKPSAKLYWCDTPYFTHGSKSGFFQPSISAET